MTDWAWTWNEHGAVDGIPVAEVTNTVRPMFELIPEDRIIPSVCTASWPKPFGRHDLERGDQ